MGPFIAGVILVIIGAFIFFLLMSPTYKMLGGYVKDVLKPFKANKKRKQ